MAGNEGAKGKRSTPPSTAAMEPSHSVIGGVSTKLLEAGARFVAKLGTENPERPEIEGISLLGLNGPLGEALFWAALARIDGLASAAERTYQLLEPVLLGLHRLRADADCHRLNLGGFIGLGGSIWGLATIAHLLADPSLYQESLAAAKMLTDERIAADTTFDVIGGTAGALLALLALLAHEPVGDSRQRLLASCRRCADHLLAKREQDGVWSPSSSGQLQSGFAHGASGIAYSLLALHQVEPSPALLAAALRAFEFERTLWVAERGRYLPFRGFDPAGTLLIAWCWGPPGIALARAAALAFLDDERIRSESQENLARMLAQKQTLEDHLCCGNLGRAAIYAHLARRNGFAHKASSPPASFAAEHKIVAVLIQNVLARAQKRGQFGYGRPELDSPWVPGFLKGSAGIGYALLYLAAPELVPCPLVLEAPPIARSRQPR